MEVEGGVHEPERPDSVAVIKGKRRDLRAVASVGRVASAKQQAETGGTGRAGKGGGGVWTGAESAPFSQTNGGETKGENAEVQRAPS